MLRGKGILTLTEERFKSIINRLHPGVAKLGIALGSGPRDRGFKSRHSDHVAASVISLVATFHVTAHSFCCGSFSNAIRCAGLAFE